MKRSIEIIYEDCIEVNGKLTLGLKTGFVDFSSRNTEYADSMPYKDNFEQFLHDTFECGFVYLTEEQVVSVFQIKKYIMIDAPKASTPKKKNSKPVAQKRRTKKAKPIVEKAPSVILPED